MRIGFLIAVVVIMASCNSTNHPFENVECVIDSSETNLGYDKVYEPCRQFIFRAKYWDKEYNLISDQRIWMMATGKRWEYDEGQAELYIQYEFDESEVERIKSFNSNEQLADREWMKSEKTGFAETQSSLWFHPFRSNQYLFTEVAPFPMVSYTNLELGAEWHGALNIHEGWGDWSDSRVEHNYYVSELVELDTEVGIINDCYHISSVGTAKFGSTTFDYWFNREYGIVKMLYRNYQKQILQIELIEVINQ